MTIKKEETYADIVQGDIYLSSIDANNYDASLNETTVFLMDIGMEVIACHASSRNEPGYFIFSYDAYTKNIFDLLDIDLDTEELKEEYVLVYRFNKKDTLEEHMKRIHDLFRKYT